MKIWFQFFFIAALINTALFINTNNNDSDKPKKTRNSELENTEEIISNLSINNSTIIPESSTKPNNLEINEENKKTLITENPKTTISELSANKESTNEVDSELQIKVTNNGTEMLLTSSTNHEKQATYPENITNTPIFNSSVNHELLAASKTKTSELNNTATNDDDDEIYSNSSSNNNFQENNPKIANKNLSTEVFANLNQTENFGTENPIKKYYSTQETVIGSKLSEPVTPEYPSSTSETPSSFSSTEINEDDSSSTTIPTDEPTDWSTESTTETTIDPSTTLDPCLDNVQVKDLNITPSPFQIHLTWSPVSDNDECNYTYVIKWKAKDEPNKPGEERTDKFEFTIIDLNACEEYEISVTVHTESPVKNDPRTETRRTTEAIEPVENLNLKPNIEQRTLLMTWNMSPRVEKCVKKYVITTYEEDKPLWSIDFYQKNMTVNNVSGCINNTYEVIAHSETKISNAESISYLDPPNPNDPPIYNEKETEINDNFVITKWTFGEYICRPERFYVRCHTEYHQEEPFEVEGEFNVQNNELIAKIDKVQPHTKYVCDGIITNRKGDSISTEPGEFETASKPPDAPENLDILEFETYLNIKWEPPKNWNGEEEIYSVLIEYNGLNYHLPEYCTASSFDPINATMSAKETEFNFPTIIPAAKYKISVKAKSDGGWGKETERNFDLKEKAPEKPVMTSELSTPTSLNVSWTTPCKMNGILKQYHYILSGIKENCSSDLNEGDIQPGEGDGDYYSKTIPNLKPDYTYTIQLRAENQFVGATTENTVTTPAGSPDAPENLDISEFNGYLNIKWEPPKKWNGNKEYYCVLIEYKELNYHLPEYCSAVIPFDPINETIDVTETEYNFSKIIPAAKYSITVKAKSDGGWGKEVQADYDLKEAYPDKPLVNHELTSSMDTNYNTSLNLTWSIPCYMHGKLQAFRIEIVGKRDNFEDDDKGIEYIPFRDSQYYSEIYQNLKPDYKYIVKVQAKNEQLGETTVLTFCSPAGIPNKPNVENLLKPNASAAPNPWESAIVYIKNDIFDQTMGNIIYYAVIVAIKYCTEEPKYKVYNSNNWPAVTSDNSSCEGDSKAYEATPQKWNPLYSSNEYNYTLGDENCTDNKYCTNRALNPDTTYFIKIRGFTKNGFSDTELFILQTEALPSDVPVGLIVGLIIGILAIAFIIAAVLFYTKGKLNIKNWPRMESTSQISPAPLPVPIKKFGSHYEKMIENPGKIKNEFQLLSTISSDVTLSTKTALLPINKKKNRYINILPFDQTRVKLQENSTNSSDYINASFIKGYSGSTEYIASQGPTEATCPAFWQMILEQNVKLIVMLTQFVESGKDKCYKYFPDLKEEYDLLNDIKIQCVEEELLNIYNKRVFKVIKNNTVKKVTHIQFNLWPDFGVPDEVHHMIDFCEIIKDIKFKKPSIIVMHCSAGVGRTGTLIAVDILLQTIRDKRKVDIFGTVLNLRKQRMTMVQSERQYEFLYKCVYNVINNNKSSNLSSKHSLDQISESNM